MAYRSIALAAAAAVDTNSAHRPDIIAEQLHTFGIYGPRDYNAWLGKISCKRLFKGVDRDLYAAADFISLNLARETSQTQAVQFVGAAIATYCPDQVGVLQAAAR